jgi:hypothetical protein
VANLGIWAVATGLALHYRRLMLGLLELVEKLERERREGGKG